MLSNKSRIKKYKRGS